MGVAAVLVGRVRCPAAALDGRSPSGRTGADCGRKGGRPGLPRNADPGRADPAFFLFACSVSCPCSVSCSCPCTCSVSCSSGGPAGWLTDRSEPLNSELTAGAGIPPPPELFRFAASAQIDWFWAAEASRRAAS